MNVSVVNCSNYGVQIADTWLWFSSCQAVSGYKLYIIEVGPYFADYNSEYSESELYRICRY